MSEFVDIEISGSLLEIRFNRPAQKNALSLEMYTAAAHALRRAGEESEINAVLLTGAAGHFSSGNDLRDFMKNPPTGQESPVFQFLLALRGCPVPVGAAVEGFAIGIGTTMLLHCDFAWASPTAKFRMPFVPLGLVPEAGASVILPAIGGHRLAAELLYFGDFFGPEKALEAGIINGIDAEVKTLGRERMTALAALPSEAMQLTKKLLRKGEDQKVMAAMQEEAAIFVSRLKSAEFMAAVAAFQK